MSDVIRSALVRAFGLYDELLESYTGKLDSCKNEKVIIDVIAQMGKDYKGKKIPSMYEIKDRYFAVFKSDEKQKVHCGVYCYKTNNLVPSGAKVMPYAEMVKVSILNPQDNKDYLWSEKEAWEYIWQCVDAWREVNKFTKAKKNNLVIDDVLVGATPAYEHVSIASNRPPITCPKKTEPDIYEASISCAEPF